MMLPLDSSGQTWKVHIFIFNAVHNFSRLSLLKNFVMCSYVISFFLIYPFRFNLSVPTRKAIKKLLRFQKKMTKLKIKRLLKSDSETWILILPINLPNTMPIYYRSGERVVRPLVQTDWVPKFGSRGLQVDKCGGQYQDFCFFFFGVFPFPHFHPTNILHFQPFHFVSFHILINSSHVILQLIHD